MMTIPKLSVAHDVYLLRHGETEWNKDHRVQGRMNSDLTELGRQQAARQAGILRDLRGSIGMHRLWASPLGRAQETAGLAFGGDPFGTDPRLAEVHCGQWEGLTPTDRMARDPDLAAACETEFQMYVSAPDGERLPDIVARASSFLNDLEAPAILVSHKITLVVLRALLTGDGSSLDVQNAPAQGSVLKISNATVTVLT